jgi:transposase
MIIERIPQTIYLCARAVDFRKCFDGLCGEVRDYLGCDPLSDAMFVFYNRRRDRLKMLLWDRDGFWLFYKRLESGTFQIPSPLDGASYRLNDEQLHLMLSGIDLNSIRRRKRYQKCN